MEPIKRLVSGIKNMVTGNGRELLLAGVSALLFFGALRLVDIIEPGAQQVSLFSLTALIFKAGLLVLVGLVVWGVVYCFLPTVHDYITRAVEDELSSFRRDWTLLSPAQRVGAFFAVCGTLLVVLLVL